MKTKKFVKYILFCDCLLVSQLAITLEKIYSLYRSEKFPHFIFLLQAAKTSEKCGVCLN